eukprot:GHUV01049614.1.p1 GENE.GHUV01049614.1~~GHUV01049614.1.p1  ORF type:complete len:137 (-),score=14.34 GHUV01049614.1:89-475(-)
MERTNPATSRSPNSILCNYAFCECPIPCKYLKTGPFLTSHLLLAPTQGPWVQRTIPNPNYYKVESPLDLLAPITAVAFELWTTEPGYTFDSVLLGVGEEGLDAAAAYMRQTRRPRHQVEVRHDGRCCN